jgi:hypothetical protein
MSTRVFRLGETARIKAGFEDAAGRLTDPVPDPTVTITDPNGVEVVTNGVTTKQEDGIWYYDYPVPSTADIGLWTDDWTATINGEPITRDLTFTVASASITTGYSKYVTKEFVAEFFDISDINEITDAHMQIGQFWVNSMLRRWGFNPDNYGSTDEDLVAACLFIMGETLSKRGIITWTVGEIEEERFGILSRRFPRWQPMFFFAQGSAEGFFELLPHQSYLMEAVQFIKRFVLSHARDTLNVTGVVVKDTSHRGYGWAYQPEAEQELTEPEDWV